MPLSDTTALILGPAGPFAVALRRRLLSLGAAVASEGPADYIFHLPSFNRGEWTPGSPRRSYERSVVAPLVRAARDSSRLRHICLLRDSAPGGRAERDDVHLMAVEDGLRFVAALQAVPVAVLRAPLRRPGWGRLSTVAAIAASLRLAGEFDLQGVTP